MNHVTFVFLQNYCFKLSSAFTKQAARSCAHSALLRGSKYDKNEMPQSNLSAD
jgi:hypothetical protein